MVAYLLILVPVLAACGATGGADGPDVRFSVSSGRFSTTVVADSETEIPFSEVIFVEARFEEEIYGKAGQTAVKITTDPSSYRVEPQRPPDLETYRAALIHNSPGTVTVSVFENSRSEPVEFTLLIGLEEPED